MRKLIVIAFLTSVCCELIAQSRTFITDEGKVTTSLKGAPRLVKADLNQTYYFVEANELKSLQGAIDGEVLHGKTTFYDKKGNIMSQGSFKSGLRHGKWMYWDNKGNIKEIITWRNGYMHGYYKKVYGDNSYEEGAWSRNRQHGKWTLTENGKLISVREFEKGEVKQKKQKRKFEIKLFKEKEKQSKEETIEEGDKEKS